MVFDLPLDELDRFDLAGLLGEVRNGIHLLLGFGEELEAHRQFKWWAGALDWRRVRAALDLLDASEEPPDLQQVREFSRIEGVRKTALSHLQGAIEAADVPECGCWAHVANGYSFSVLRFLLRQRAFQETRRINRNLSDALERPELRDPKVLISLYSFLLDQETDSFSQAPLNHHLGERRVNAWAAAVCRFETQAQLTAERACLIEELDGPAGSERLAAALRNARGLTGEVAVLRGLKEGFERRQWLSEAMSLAGEAKRQLEALHSQLAEPDFSALAILRDISEKRQGA